MDFIGCGALNLDRLFKVQRITKGDEEVAIQDVKEQPGGSAANTIYALGKLGKKVGFIGSIGEDFESKMVLESLQSAGVDTSQISVKSKIRTGLVIGIVDAAGERSLYIAPGANNQLEIQDINVEFLGHSEFLHLTSFVNEDQLKVQKKMVSSISGETKLSFSPGSLYAKMGLDAMSPIISRTHVIFINEVEATIFTGSDTYIEAAEDLIQNGCRIVVVTLGEKGCYINDGSQKVHIDAFTTDVLDTTGAGDAFCAGFLFGLSEGKDLSECGKIGNFMASKCISKIGARTGLLDKDELEKGIADLL
jgi:ribokinase